MTRLVNFLFIGILICFQLVWASPAVNNGGMTSTPVGFTVRYHPDGGLQVGDQVSIQVTAPPGFHGDGAKLQVRLVQLEKKSLGESGFTSNGLGQLEATFLWVWDTHGLAPGVYRLEFVLNSGTQTWQETVSLEPAPAGPEPQWIEREMVCCRLHVISGTAAARDLDPLAQVIDERAGVVASRMGYDLSGSSKSNGSSSSFKKLDINLIPRVLGQGGFTSDEVTVSYDDRLYSVIDFGVVAQHELVHRIDAEQGGELRPTLFTEGLAVYLTGGHYKSEPLLTRAVFLLRQGGYLSLPVLAENFYDHQHEAAYLQAAALIDYMVRSWGWDAFNRFYRDIHPAASQKEAEAIDTALKSHFGLTLAQLDDRFTGFLEQQPVLPDLGEDLAVTLSFFDTIREYQQQLDSSAYFRQVWLPDPRAMRERGITADYLRGPRDEPNRAIEDLLWQAGQAWRDGRFNDAWRNLGAARGAINESSSAHPIPNNVQSLKSSITRIRMISSRIPMTMNDQIGVRVRTSTGSTSGFIGICPEKGGWTES